MWLTAAYQSRVPAADPIQPQVLKRSIEMTLRRTLLPGIGDRRRNKPASGHISG
jgi:hypothetical protein